MLLVLLAEVDGLVGDGVVEERAWAAGEEDACARALESSAAARAAWLALVGEPPLPRAVCLGGIGLSRVDLDAATMMVNLGERCQSSGTRTKHAFMQRSGGRAG